MSPLAWLVPATTLHRMSPWYWGGLPTWEGWQACYVEVLLETVPRRVRMVINARS